MSTLPTHRNQPTGSAVLDRIQANVRDLIAIVRQLYPRLTTAERAHGVGHKTVLMRDANYTLTAAEMDAATWEFSGTHTATRVAILRDAGDEPYVRWATNVTGQIVTLKTKDGSANLAASSTRAVRVTSAGPAFLT